ncbi:hypothetical protein D3H55_22015 [Bacillus salacetis]|uniref:Uncharacterized protein n=1 Tax=Bacillus salacetis TaxID=2315464 RepID=A0A3A1QSK8_9BACI|nr:DUF5344 family protein [Bacillus salacetis]RIW28243.1 hypothetical protein D3H55_22015 [Bacillus salacetis]
MNTDIIIRIGEINEILSTLQSAAESFDPSLIKDTASANQLDMVNRLNEINILLEEVGEVYKGLLMENNHSARKAILDFKETDDDISASIRLR